MSGQLPTFEDTRSRTFALRGEARDELRSDWRPGTGPDRGQGAALHRALDATAQAKTPLAEAARAADAY